jgi:hypothetical protein
VRTNALTATSAALAACIGVLCAGVPLLPLQALGAIAIAAAIGWFASRSFSSGAGACIAFAAAIAQHTNGDWKTVVALGRGALATPRWYAAAIVAATLLFFFA